MVITIMRLVLPHKKKNTSSCLLSLGPPSSPCHGKILLSRANRSFLSLKDSVSLVAPSLLPRPALKLNAKKFFREINYAGLGGLINSSCQLIVLRWRREKPPKRVAAALNQFHGPFITSAIKPIFRFQVFFSYFPFVLPSSYCCFCPCCHPKLHSDRRQDSREGTRTHLLTVLARGLERASQTVCQGSSGPGATLYIRSKHAAEQARLVLRAAQTLQLPVCQNHTQAPMRLKLA